jgi:hypothetical protein
MSTIEQTPVLAEVVDRSDSGRKRGCLDRLEQWLEPISERLNPILVKEARQALKSRQFSVTFALLLIAAWAWSVLGAVINMPEIYYAPTGDDMLIGYYFVLAVPLLIIVPFSACRSLATEREDGTFELLSITTLSSRQIVTGKLGSAILQMIVYYSALAPCIVFTYLLRGVDIITIVLLLLHTFLASVVLSAVGLMFAGLSGSRAWQMFLSVALLFTLIMAVWGWFVAVFALMYEIRFAPYDEPEFWIANALAVTLYFTYLAIAILAAAAQNSFASDNRSTRIRVAIVVQMILFVGWITWLWNLIGDWEFICVMLMLAAIHLYVYGIFLTGESGRLSPRVKRNLPVTWAGRTLLTWFNPGSGTGYVFVVCNLAVLCAAAFVAVKTQEEFGFPNNRFAQNIPTGRAYVSMVLILEYVTLYLGIGRLCLLLVPRRERFGVALPLATHLLIAVCAILVPLSIQSFSRNLVLAGYTWLQIPNWGWTIVEAVDRGLPFPEVPYVLGGMAIIVFLINLVLTAREIEVVRHETPIRVKREDEELAMAR